MRHTVSVAVVASGRSGSALVWWWWSRSAIMMWPGSALVWWCCANAWITAASLSCYAADPETLNPAALIAAFHSYSLYVTLFHIPSIHSSFPSPPPFPQRSVEFSTSHRTLSQYFLPFLITSSITVCLFLGLCSIAAAAAADEWMNEMNEWCFY